MSVWSKIQQSPLMNEIRDNTRLQWMIIVIAAILMVSLSKSYSDLILVKNAERDQQYALYNRMLTAANQPLDENTITNAENIYQQAFSKLPKAVSDSVAQAQALKRMDQIIAGKIIRSRVTLISSEPQTFGSQSGWQVRINVAGQMPEKSLIQLLADVSGDHPDARLLSMQYNPKVSNSIAFVVDFLYLSEQRNES